MAREKYVAPPPQKKSGCFLWTLFTLFVWLVMISIAVICILGGVNYIYSHSVGVFKVAGGSAHVAKYARNTIIPWEKTVEVCTLNLQTKIENCMMADRQSLNLPFWDTNQMYNPQANDMAETVSKGTSEKISQGQSFFDQNKTFFIGGGIAVLLILVLILLPKGRGGDSGGVETAPKGKESKRAKKAKPDKKKKRGYQAFTNHNSDGTTSGHPYR